MRPRSAKRIYRIFTGLCCVVAVSLLVPPVKKSMSAMAVIDSQNLAKNSAMTTTLSKSLSEQQAMTQLVTDNQNLLQKILSSTGASTDFTGLSDLGGLLKLGNAIADGNILGITRNLGGISPDLKPIHDIANVGGGIRNKNFNSVNDYMSMARRVFRLWGRLQPTQKQDVFDATQALARDARDVAYATSAYNLSTAETTNSRVDTMMNSMTNSENLNERIAILGGIMAAVIEEMAQSRAMNAAYINYIMASSYAGEAVTLSNDPDIPPPQTDDGSDELPDIFK